MGILRSEDMLHGTLVIPADRAADVVETLGCEGVVEIQDMNAESMSRPYKRYMQRIEEMERMLRYLTEEINKLPGTKIETGKIDNFLQRDKEYQLDTVEESLQTLYTQFVKFRENNDDLLSQKYRMIMERAVTQAALTSFLGGQSTANASFRESSQTPLSVSQHLDQNDVGADMSITGFNNFAGVVLQTEQEKLARTLFRATRGNAFTHIEELAEDFSDENGNSVRRSVFVVYYQGGPGSALHDKINRICQAFGAEIFEWPKSRSEAIKKIGSLGGEIEDKAKALEGFEEFFLEEISVLLEIVRPGGNSLIEEWRLFCEKQKSLYACLNLFEGTEATLRADCWYPREEEENIRSVLSNISFSQFQVSAFLVTDKDLPKHCVIPTYIKVTTFTEAFQNFVNTYGVPRYKEVNPALLTIVTFPYLFGIMYGDIGHGFFVLVGGISLVAFSQKIRESGDEMNAMIEYGKWMIVMMGCFAVYSGFLYNEYFSLGLDIFGTRFVQNTTYSGVDANETQWVANPDMKFPYPFGLDPMWKGSENELSMTNSFKMKYSVLIGGTQMTVGVLLKAFNAIYFHDNLTLWFEFIPQLLFMISLVGYMDFLIVYKWIVPKDVNIITTIINMCMLTPLTDEMTIYQGQATVQSVLFLLMILSVPWMLLPKPIIRAIQHRGQKPKKEEVVEAVVVDAALEATQSGIGKAPTATTSGNNGRSSNGSGKMLLSQNGAATALLETGAELEEIEEEVEEFEFGEEFIHQMIETIEFVLGTVSNTASYLRLWALSLAHQQLALVFFEKIVLMVLDSSVTPDGNVIVPGIMLFFAFAVFAVITFAILMGMDVLECFLHALRLQWVEFQNKFYKADGVRFIPFNFNRILKHLDQD